MESPIVISCRSQAPLRNPYPPSHSHPVLSRSGVEPPTGTIHPRKGRGMESPIVISCRSQAPLRNPYPPSHSRPVAVPPSHSLPQTNGFTKTRLCSKLQNRARLNNPRHGKTPRESSRQNVPDSSTPEHAIGLPDGTNSPPNTPQTVSSESPTKSSGTQTTPRSVPSHSRETTTALSPSETSPAPAAFRPRTRYRNVKSIPAGAST